MDEREGALTLVLGIDPGKNGAAALIRVEAGVITQGHVWPIVLELLAPLVTEASLVVVEAQHASPQQGVRSAFALGLAYGGVRGALAAVPNLKVVYVQPTVWRGAYGLGGGPAGKAAGVAMAREILQQPERVLTHDEADAVLLAWYGWRNILRPEGNP
jgi:Holliday junction resolvasome RuvABC endonuclease subunit